VSAKPLLFLDIDGVLAPFNMQVPPNGFTLRRPEGAPVSFYFSDELGRGISELARDFEIVWATHWQQWANRVISPLCGLDQLETLSFRFRHRFRGDERNEPDWAAIYEELRSRSDYDEILDHTPKLHNVAAFAGDRPCVWVDDALGQDAGLWALRRAAPTLLIRTEPHLGLTEEQLEEIRTFAHGLASSGD
jgi:hypothetical protein